MKTCKYCQMERPDESFEVCRVVAGKAYRRLRCKKCKRTKTAERRWALRHWLEDYKKTLRCERCGFADHRAFEFHHCGVHEKNFNVGDMIRSGLSRSAIKREMEKCVV
ncbi:MAG TPA: hypothetical protein VG013_32430, partial [Gemmataceae bacterium]|nr:hypothetical protein [Gemmataceae bacterium]